MAPSPTVAGHGSKRHEAASSAMNRRDRRLAKKAARKGGGGSGIAAAPPAIQQRFQRAVTLFQAGDGAAERVLRALERDAPGLPEVSHLLGVVLLRTGRARDAIAPLDFAVKAMPRDAAPCTLLGVACETAGDLDDAIAAFRQGILRDRAHTDTHYNLANALRRKGADAEAAESYRAAIRLEPDFADAHYNLGLALARLGDLAEAAERFRRAIALGPDRADGYIGLSNALAMALDYDAAARAAEAALDRAPDSAEAHKAMASALQGQGRIAEAAEILRRAIERAPGTCDLHTRYGNMLEELGESALAEAAYRQAVALDPDYAIGHVNLAALLLTTGRYDEGWREYDWHWRRAGLAPRPFPQPRWTDEAPAGRTILAWADEGAGDEILFASQFAALAARGAGLVIECDRRLADMFRRAFPVHEVVARTDPPAARLLRPDIDLQAPFSELPRRLGLDLARAPAPKAPYLQAQPALSAACRARYRALGDGPDRRHRLGQRQPEAAGAQRAAGAVGPDPAPARAALRVAAVWRQRGGDWPGAGPPRRRYPYRPGHRPDGEPRAVRRAGRRDGHRRLDHQHDGPHGRRARQDRVDDAALRGGLALPAGARRHALVPGDAAVPPDRGAAMARRDRARGGRAGAVSGRGYPPPKSSPTRGEDLIKAIG